MNTFIYQFLFNIEYKNKFVNNKSYNTKFASASNFHVHSKIAIKIYFLRENQYVFLI